LITVFMPKPVSFHDLSAGSAVPPALLVRAVTDLTSFCEQAQPIIDAVRLEGDAALQRFVRAHGKIHAGHPG
jgi:histidinol dehydrogenase